MVITRYDVVPTCVLIYVMLTLVHICGTKEPNTCITCTKYILYISINATTQNAVSFMIWVATYVNAQLYNFNRCTLKHK